MSGPFISHVKAEAMDWLKKRQAEEAEWGRHVERCRCRKTVEGPRYMGWISCRVCGLLVRDGGAAGGVRR